MSIIVEAHRLWSGDVKEFPDGSALYAAACTSGSGTFTAILTGNDVVAVTVPDGRIEIYASGDEHACNDCGTMIRTDRELCVPCEDAERRREYDETGANRCPERE